MNKEIKIYLASKFSLRQKVEYLSNYLVTHGFSITCKWWNDDIKQLSLKAKGNIDDEWYRFREVIAVSERDYRGIDNADVVILVSTKEPMSFNGANIEIGYAIAKGKKIFILGAVDRCALYRTAVFCGSVDKLMYELKKLNVR